MSSTGVGDEEPVEMSGRFPRVVGQLRSRGPYVFGTLAVAQVLLIVGIENGFVGILYLLSLPVGTVLVHLDISRRRDDAWAWTWRLGALCPLLSHGVLAGYALSRARKPGGPFWLAAAWGGLLVQVPPWIVMLSTDPDAVSWYVGGGTLSILFLGSFLAPFALYVDARAIDRRTIESFYPRLWTLVASVWLFNVAGVVGYTVYRTYHTRRASRIDERLDSVERDLDAAVGLRRDGEYEAAVERLDGAGTALSEIEASDAASAEPFSGRTGSLQSRLEQERESTALERATGAHDAALERARSALSAAEQAATDDDYERAVERATEAIERAGAALGHVEDVDVDGQEAEKLRAKATDRAAELEREWLVERINEARANGAEEFERATSELEEVLVALGETDALSGRDRELLQEEARGAYRHVLTAGTSASLDHAITREEAGDYEGAEDAFRETLTRATDALEALDKRDIDGNEELLEAKRAAESGFADVQVQAIERRIERGIDAFESGDHEGARDTFADAEEAAAAAMATVEGEDQRERLSRLRDLAEDNADAARRDVLGIGEDTSSLRKPGESVEGSVQDGIDQDDEQHVPSGDRWGTGPGGPPLTIPGAPAFDVEYDDITREEQVGEGSRAIVYRATVDVGASRHEAALKVPRKRGTLHADEMEQFVDEAETWSGLDDNDFIVGVIDAGTRPLPWLLLEYMDAGNLAGRGGELPVDQAVWTARCVSEAVNHAHRHGVAHLDLKPENILLRTTGEDTWPVPKVADWGLARAMLDADVGVEGLSPSYAAPEQVDPDRFGGPDQATDVYQLGAVFYDLFVGHPPFTGDAGDVLTSVVEDDVTPPSEVDPSLPSAVDDALLPALQREKHDRYESVLYLRDALADLTSD